MYESPREPSETSEPFTVSSASDPGVSTDLSDALSAIVVEESADFSIAVTHVGTGISADYGTAEDPDHTYDTASIVKVGILTTLLLQHQEAGTDLTAEQRRLATEMITWSSNDATDVLWAHIGGSEGFDTASATLGLTATTGGPGGLWGLTQTTAADQLTLLGAVFGDGSSPLSTDSRTYARDLMGQVVPEQTWGVSAAAGDGGAYALKNGWLPRSTTELWDVNSIGWVERGEHALLIAVVSKGHTTLEGGIRLVSDAAATAAAVLAPDSCCDRERSPGQPDGVGT